LNADHTHFIIYDDNKNINIITNYSSFCDGLDLLFAIFFAKNFLPIPIVSIRICGDLKSTDAIEFKLENDIPVIIFKGSGGAADIISYAFEELDEK
jgi:hypothetical protein